MSLSPEIQPNSLPMTPDACGKFCMVEKMRQNTADFHIFHVFLFCLQALCWKTARSSSEFPVCCKLHVELRRGVGRTASLLNEIRHVSKHKRVHGIHPAFVEARANGQTRHACKQVRTLSLYAYSQIHTHTRTPSRESACECGDTGREMQMILSSSR